MANKYPYVASAGPLVKAVSHLRKSFPKEVTADTLRKLGVAPKNESYVINVLRFLGVIDDEGQKVSGKAGAFLQHQEQAFASEFGKVVREAYEEIFELHGDAAWTLDRDALTQFFRTTDHSSDVVGSRQASTFSALAALSGHAEVPKPKTAQGSTKPSTTPSTKPKPAKAMTGKQPSHTETKVPPGTFVNGNERSGQVGLAACQPNIKDRARGYRIPPHFGLLPLGTTDCSSTQKEKPLQEGLFLLATAECMW